jgi:hypothetical protein
VWPDCITVLMLVWMILVVSPRAGQIKPFILKKNFYRPDVLLLKDLFHNVYNAVTKAPKLDGIVTTTKS